MRQPTNDEMTDNIEMMLDWRRNKFQLAKVYGGLCAAPFHYLHFEQLLSDMGATEMKRSLIADNFLPIDADAFADHLRSTPSYSVS